MQKATKCVHAGTIKSPLQQGVNSPIYTSTSFIFLDPEKDELLYPRHFNTANQKAVVAKMCALENGEGGLVFGSGMAAITTTLFALLQKGDHAIFQDGLYGGTYHYIISSLPKYGIDYSFVEIQDPEAVEQALRPNTKVIYIETPSNPLLKITDIAAVAAFAKKNNLVSVIDNTFATPINQNPLTLGIDVSLHSGTKYLGGHSDICCGAVVTSKELAKRIDECANQLGGSLDANTCYLLERSLKTLSLRITRQNENALHIARHLRNNSNIEKVFYPGLEDHDGRDIAVRQMSGFGGMLSFELKGDGKTARRFLENLKLIPPATSLGGVETLICIPALTSHAEVSKEDREAMGIKDQLIRVSVGIEDPGDLLADILFAASHAA